jgi:diketogulonate reductase-like aldo/keto reductase
LLGLGTYGHKDSGDAEKTYQAVKDAIVAGYRHIDTAFVYGVEDVVGKAINDCIDDGVVTRDEVFVTTKLWLTSYRRDRVHEAIKESLKQLNLSYVDLYLIHWPVPLSATSDTPSPDGGADKIDDSIDIHNETWAAMEEVKAAGLAKSIGVSNYNEKLLTDLLAVAKVKPAINQIESHPFLSQKSLIKFCRGHGIELTAYSPLGGSPFDAATAMPGQLSADVRAGLFENELVKSLALKYKKSAGQILLKFQVQRKVPTIPKSVTKSRIIENGQIFDFELTGDELSALEGMNRDLRYVLALMFKDSKYYPF